MSKTFLIVKPSSLGDILHTFPAVSTLCRETGAVADWLILPAFAPLLRYLPCVRKSIPFERNRLGSVRSFLPAFRRLWKDLRAESYDAVIDFQGLLRSAAAAFCARSNIHAGPAHPKEAAAKLFYSRKLFPAAADPCKKPRHAVERNNAFVAGFLGRDELDFSFTMPRVEEYSASASALLNSCKIPPGAPLIGVAPGARWKTKQWPPAFFAALIKELETRVPDAHFLLAGSAAEQETATEILRLSGSPNVSNLCGRTDTGALVEIIRECRLFLCNDSGPMHIAALLGIPVLALFGPTSPELTGPFSPASRVIRPDLDCLCCFKRECETSLCHTALDPVAVAAEALELMMTKGRRVS